MTPIWAWARRELLRHRRATLALVLLIGISGAVVLTTAAGARRTASAFERFQESSHTADVRLQYSTERVDDRAISDRLVADPAIERAVPMYITVAFSEGSDYDLGIFASPSEELFTTIDEPKLLEGRRPDPQDPHEVLVNPFTRDALGAEVGDVVTVGTFTAEQFNGEDLFEEPAGPEIPLEITGVSITSYDIADPEFTGFFGTPAFYERYWGEVGGFGPTLQIETVPGRSPDAAIEAAVADFELTDVFVDRSSAQAKIVNEGTQVLSVGLWVFASVAGLAALVAGAQALHRRMAEATDDLPALRSLGLSRVECTMAVLASALPTVIVGSLLALVLAIVGSATMPIGTARRAEPSPGIDVDPVALGLGTLLLLAVFGIAAVAGAVRTTQVGLAGSSGGRVRRPAASLLASGRFSPASQLGVTMALDPGGGRTAVPVRSAVVGVAFGVLGVVGALTFGNGLDALVEDPAASGWNWTFSPDVSEEDVSTLAAVEGVEDLGAIRFGQVRVEGRRMAGVSMQAEKGTPSFTVVAGRLPSGPREVALGPKTADDLHLSIGDEVRLGDPNAEDAVLDAVLVGRVLMPVFDDNSFNEGIALTPETHDLIAEEGEGFEQHVVRFADEVPSEEAARRVRAVLPEALPVYAFPTPPPDVAHLEGVQSLPRLLGLFLGLLALAAVGHALATSVRRRRHDLGIVRSVGFRAVDVLRTLTAQSLTLVAIGVVLGIPLGMALGRVAWSIVASGIGVRGSASTSVGVVVAVVTVSCLAGALLSVLPGISAARQRAVDALRAE